MDCASANSRSTRSRARADTAHMRLNIHPLNLCDGGRETLEATDSDVRVGVAEHLEPAAWRVELRAIIDRRIGRSLLRRNLRSIVGTLRSEGVPLRVSPDLRLRGVRLRRRCS